MKQITGIVLISVLAAAVIWSLFFPEWHFASYQLQVAARIVTPFIVCWFIAWLIALRIENKATILSVVIVTSTIAGCSSYFALRPLDSCSIPKETVILQNFEGNRKIIAREFYNYKHNQLERDTLLVEDRIIFRREVNSIPAGLLNSVRW